jgi:hypothetical protein
VLRGDHPVVHRAGGLQNRYRRAPGSSLMR